MKIKLRGACMIANVVNNNNRLYPIEALENAHNVIQSAILNNGYLLGEPLSNTLEINIQNVSHKITNSYIESNTLFVEAELLDSISGNIIKDMILSGLPIYFTSRGSGEVTANNTVENYELTTVDISYDTSFNLPPCEVIKEHIEISNNIKYNNFVKEIIDNEIDKILG